MEKTAAKTAAVLATVFILSALLCGSIASMTASPVFFVPVIHGPTPSDFLLGVWRVSRATFICAGLVFLSGFTVFPRKICAGVTVLRGFALGLALSFERSGAILYLRNRKVLFIPTSVLIPLLFVLSALLMIFMSSVAVAFSAKNADVSPGSAPRAAGVIKYVFVFLVAAGALIALDVLRYYLI